MEYLTTNDLQDRLTAVGLQYVADRNGDGTIDTDERASALDSAIRFAGNLIDTYIGRQVDLNVARGSENGWLRDRGVDLAAYRAVSQGGRDAPAVLEVAYRDAVQLLKRVQAGERIPGYAYPAPKNAWYAVHTPKAANLSGRDSAEHGRRPFGLP